MNKLIKTLPLLIVLLIFSTSTAQVKAKEKWKADNFDVVKSKKILVISKMRSEGIRQRGEQTITNKLKELGLDATEAFVAFPYLNVKLNRTPEELDAVIKQIIDAGYGAIVITKLKNPESQHSATTRLTENDEIEEQKKIDKSYDTSSYGKYPVSFGVYFNDPVGNAPNRTPGPSGLEETTTNYSEVFSLETLTYNISVNEEQLLASTSINITDPDNVMKILEKYAKIVAKQFDK